RVALRDRVHLRHRFVDLRHSARLLRGCGSNVLHQLGGLPYGWHEVRQQLSGSFGHANALAGQSTDLLRRHLAPLGQLSNFDCDHRKSPALVSCARRFDGGVECKQIGLVGDLFDHPDLGGNLLHGSDRLFDRLATLFRRGGTLGSRLLHLPAVVGILGNGRIHLLQAGAHLLHRSSLFARSLRKTLRRGRDLLRRRSDRGGPFANVPDDARQPAAHFLHGLLQLAGLGTVCDRYLPGQIAGGNTLRVRDGLLDRNGNALRNANSGERGQNQSDDQYQQSYRAPHVVSVLALLHALRHGGGLKVNELLPRGTILVECGDHLRAQRCQCQVALLVRQQTLSFVPGRNVGLPVLGDDLKLFPLMGRAQTLFNFRDLSADFVTDRLVLLVQLLLFIEVGGLEQLQRDTGVSD